VIGLTNAIDDSTLEEMAQLVVRQLDESLVQRLREQAARAGISMEEAHRRILRQSLVPENGSPRFIDHLLAIPIGSDDELFERRRTISRRKSW
jgi:plasmid stability protein